MLKSKGATRERFLLSLNDSFNDKRNKLRLQRGITHSPTKAKTREAAIPLLQFRLQKPIFRLYT